MRESEYDANQHLASWARAGAVIDAGCKQRWTALERAERRREYGAKAVGMLTALLRMGELPECHRERARQIISEWER